MSITLVEGFDMYNGIGANTGLQARWTPTYGTTGALSLISGRFGGQAMRASPGISTSGAYAAAPLPASVSSVSVGFAYRQLNLTTNDPFFWLRDVSTFQVGLAVNTAGSIVAGRYSAVNSSTTLGTSATGVIHANTWHYVEVEVTISSTVGVINVYVDGTSVLSLSSVNTQNSTNATVNMILLGMWDGGAPSQNWDFDDLYVTNVATKLGESRVETLRPASDSSKQFTPDSGVTNYSRVNETLVDGDTSYVQDSVVGDRDLYTIGTLSSTPTTIRAVNIVSFAEKTDSTSRSLYNSVQSAGTDSDGSAIALAGTYSRFDRIIANDPNGGGVWTASRVNGLLIGPKVAA